MHKPKPGEFLSKSRQTFKDRLEQMEVIQKNYVVKSIDGTAIAKFPTFVSLPNRVRDDIREQDVKVNLDNIEVRYEFINS